MPEMVDQIAFLAATHPPELQEEPTKRLVTTHTTTGEPGSPRVRRLIAAVQCAISICAIIYAMACRFVVRFVDHVHNVSDLSLAALLMAMLCTLLSGVFGALIDGNQVPQYRHPSSLRLGYLVLTCTAAYLNVTAFVTQALAIWFSQRLVPYFPMQGVELPHHAFLLVLTVFCCAVSLVSVYRYISDLLRAFSLEEKLRTRTLSVVT